MSLSSGNTRGSWEASCIRTEKRDYGTGRVGGGSDGLVTPGFSFVFWRRNDARATGVCSQDGVCEPVYYCTEEEAGLWSKVKERPEEA